MSRKKQARQYRPVIDKDRNDKARALAHRWQVESESEAVRRAIDLAYAEEDVRSQLREAQAQVSDVERYLREKDIAEGQPIDAAVAALVADNKRLEAEANQSSVRAECLSNDIEAAVSQLEHAGLIDADDELARPLTDDCTRIERVVRRYKHVCELKEATEATARAAQENYAEVTRKRTQAERERDQAQAERDGRLAASREHLAARDQAEKERDHLRSDRDRVIGERDKALSELAARDTGLGRGWWTGWTIGIACGTAGTLLATWLASGGLG